MQPTNATTAAPQYQSEVLFVYDADELYSAAMAKLTGLQIVSSVELLETAMTNIADLLHSNGHSDGETEAMYKSRGVLNYDQVINFTLADLPLRVRQGCILWNRRRTSNDREAHCSSENDTADDDSIVSETDAASISLENIHDLVGPAGLTEMCIMEYLLMREYATYTPIPISGLDQSREFAGNFWRCLQSLGVGIIDDWIADFDGIETMRKTVLRFVRKTTWQPDRPQIATTNSGKQILIAPVTYRCKFDAAIWWDGHEFTVDTAGRLAAELEDASEVVDVSKLSDPTAFISQFKFGR